MLSTTYRTEVRNYKGWMIEQIYTCNLIKGQFEEIVSNLILCTNLNSGETFSIDIQSLHVIEKTKEAVKIAKAKICKIVGGEN